jgi:hypothetical protein
MNRNLFPNFPQIPTSELESALRKAAGPSNFVEYGAISLRLASAVPQFYGSKPAVLPWKLFSLSPEGPSLPFADVKACKPNEIIRFLRGQSLRAPFMLIQVRPADLIRERAILIELFKRFLTRDFDEKRFEWLYHANPCGSARAWVACESVGSAVIGAAAAFPRRISFSGVEKEGWVLGDFCLDERYRSLGPALQLQRACLEVTRDSSGAFCYDFPSERMMAIYKRLGVTQTGIMVRWARPLRATRRIESVVRSKTLAKALAAPVEIALTYRGWKGDREAGDLQLHEGQCDEEFDLLNDRVCRMPGIFTIRTAKYLNWRYLANPTAKCEILTARREGALVGYAVFTSFGNEGRIVDLCSEDAPGLIGLLLAGVVQELSPRGIETISLNAWEFHPWSHVFERAAFRRRETAPVVTYAPQDSQMFGSKHQPSWYLMQGERDI